LRGDLLEKLIRMAERRACTERYSKSKREGVLHMKEQKLTENIEMF